MKLTSYPEPQTGAFAFDEGNMGRVERILKRYPPERKASAILPLLDIAQRQNGGWLSKECIEYVADFLEIAPIRAWEVATFYTMLNLKPVGKHFIQVCRTTPCWLRGSDELTQACRKRLGVGKGEVTEDGLFSYIEVECLGACVNAPMVQINDDYYEDLTPDRLVEIIDRLENGEAVPIGSQTERQGSAPEGGPETLREMPWLKKGAPEEGDLPDYGPQDTEPAEARQEPTAGPADKEKTDTPDRAGPDAGPQSGSDALDDKEDK